MAKVLVVDDEKDIADILEAMLRSYGHEVTKAHDGLEAFDKVKEETPDIVLLDVMLPVLDGNTVCRMLKTEDVSKDIPVIMLTARNREKDRMISMNLCQADRYLTKPFEESDIINAINELTRKQD